MVSKTKRTDAIRKRKMRTNGAARKLQMKNKGTTPKFAVHLDKK